MIIMLLLLLAHLFYAGVVCMVGIGYPLMAFHVVASAVFRRVERASPYPRNFWAFLAAAASYVVFAGLLFSVYAGIGYLAGLIDHRSWTADFARLMTKSNDNLWWLAFDGLVVGATVAIVVFFILGILLAICTMISASIEFVVWLFRR